MSPEGVDVPFQKL